MSVTKDYYIVCLNSMRKWYFASYYSGYYHVSAILSATISYHSYFKVQASLLMSAICTNEVVTVLKITDIDSQNCFHNITILEC